MTFRAGQHQLTDARDKVIMAINKSDKMEYHPMIGNASVASTMSGAMAKTMTAPLDLAKIYLTHPDRSFSMKNSFMYLRRIYTQGGMIHLWRGNSAAMAKVVPHYSIQFMAHEQYKNLLGPDSHIKCFLK